MAERTVNVRINYVVNTADINRAQQASAAAQKATDNLREATKQYGKAAQEAGKASSDAVRKTQQDVSSLTKEFNSLYSTIRTVVTAGIAREFIDLTLNVAKLSGTLEGVNRAFSRLPNATILMDQLRKATHGTVTDLELMQRALMAANFRIPLEKLGTLLEFAAVKAQQTGQEVNHLINYIVSGIGYRSIKRLDDLGFTANRVKEALGGVSLQAADMGQVMDAVAKLMNEDLQKTGGYAETSATEVGKLETKWAKLKTTVSGILTSPAVIRFYDRAIEVLQRGAEGFAGTYESNLAKAQGVENAKLTLQRLLTKDILEDKQKTFDVVQQEANTLQQNIGRNNDEIKVLRAKRDAITDSGRMMNYQEAEQVKKINEQIQYYNFKNIAIKETIKALNDYNRGLDLGKQDLGDQLGIVEALRAEIEAINEDIEATKDRGDLGVGGALIKRRNDLQKQLDELLGKTKDSTKKSANEVAEYLANLSDLELFQSKKMLEDRRKAREDEAKRERENAERSLKLQEYFAELRLKKQQETEEEEIEIMEDSAAKKRRLEEDFRAGVVVGIGISTDLIKGLEQAELNSLQIRLANLRDFYDEQQVLAGDNEAFKKQLRLEELRETKKLQNEIAEREWKIRRSAILIDTAAGIAKAIATYPYPAFLVPAAFAAAEGAAQLSVADANRPRFAKGVLNLQGPGTETSDSIPSLLSKGESVMTAEETRRSMGLLKAIKQNKIDDKILQSIDFNGGRTVEAHFNDERIVGKLDQIVKSQYTLEQQGRLLFRVYKDADGNKKRIRSKSI